MSKLHFKFDLTQSKNDILHFLLFIYLLYYIIFMFEHHFQLQFDHTNFVQQKQIIPFLESSGNAYFKNGIICFHTWNFDQSTEPQCKSHFF